MTSLDWSERAQGYVDSDAHREGADLDLLVVWAAGAGTALDVATGGGHVARRLRELSPRRRRVRDGTGRARADRRLRHRTTTPEVNSWSAVGPT